MDANLFLRKWAKVEQKLYLHEVKGKKQAALNLITELIYLVAVIKIDMPCRWHVERLPHQVPPNGLC